MEIEYYEINGLGFKYDPILVLKNEINESITQLRDYKDKIKKSEANVIDYQKAVQYYTEKIIGFQKAIEILEPTTLNKK
jgi:hypothetical protein